MRDFEMLVGQVTAKAVACPDPVAIQAIRDSFAELCDKALLWMVDDTFTIQPGEPELIFVPAPARLIRLQFVNHVSDSGGERELEPVTLDWLNHRHRHWRDDFGPPRMVVQSHPNSINVVPMNGPANVHIRAFLRPSMDADRGPAHLLDKYESAIIHGALRRVLTIPKQEWTDNALGNYHGTMFESELDRVAYDGMRGIQNAPLRSRANYF